MEDRETARMRKYGESKTTRIMMDTVPHVTSGLGLRKFQVDGFLLTRVYNYYARDKKSVLVGSRIGLASFINPHLVSEYTPNSPSPSFAPQI